MQRKKRQNCKEKSQLKHTRLTHQVSPHPSKSPSSGLNFKFFGVNNLLQHILVGHLFSLIRISRTHKNLNSHLMRNPGIKWFTWDLFHPIKPTKKAPIKRVVASIPQVVHQIQNGACTRKILLETTFTSKVLSITIWQLKIEGPEQSIGSQSCEEEVNKFCPT